MKMLKQKLSTVACSMLISGVVLSSNAQADNATNPNARDIKILTNWFAGEFDNEEQLWFERDPRSNTPKEDIHTRVHTRHVPVEIPELGEHVYYVQEYINNNPEEIIRQRIAAFQTNDENQIIMKNGFIKEADRFKDSADSLSGLSYEDVFFIDGCDLIWSRKADQFEAKMNDKACAFGEGDKHRYSVHNLVLSAKKYWRQDMTFLVSDDSFHSGTKPGEFTQMRRVDRFTCEVSFRSEEGVQTEEGLSLHSQGGTVDLVRESDGKSITLMMRQKEYPYYEERPNFMFFSVRETGQRRSIAYAVTDAKARRVGVSANGVNAHCYLNGYQFMETRDELLETLEY